MIKIKNLEASIDDKTILKGIDLEIPAGEVHVIMGRNGSGKSTLANVIAGVNLLKCNYSANTVSILQLAVKIRIISPF